MKLRPISGVIAISLLSVAKAWNSSLAIIDVDVDVNIDVFVCFAPDVLSDILHVIDCLPTSLTVIPVSLWILI